MSYTFDQVYEATVRRKGLDPASVTLDAGQQEAIAEWITERTLEAWDWGWWPELLELERRQYRADWDAGKTYATGDEVYYAPEDKYYVALQASTNKNPASETDYWEEQDELDRYVALDQTGETEIHAVRRAAKRNPRVSDYPDFLEVGLSKNGIQFDTLAPSRPYLEFKRPPPRFTRTAWSEATTYAKGALVYVASTGQCYESLQAANLNKNPTSETSWWTVQTFPTLFFDWIRRAAKVDALREDGEETKADRQESAAYEKLANLYDVKTAAQKQFRTAEVRLT